jgi:hypothetical protein
LKHFIHRKHPEGVSAAKVVENLTEVIEQICCSSDNLVYKKES